MVRSKGLRERVFLGLRQRVVFRLSSCVCVQLGVSVVDRFTFTTLRFVEDALKSPNPAAWSLQK